MRGGGRRHHLKVWKVVTTSLLLPLGGHPAPPRRRRPRPRPAAAAALATTLGKLRRPEQRGGADVRHAWPRPLRLSFSSQEQGLHR
jgi:hypothetical protein